MKDHLKKISPLVLRYGIALVFLWFGINQLMYSSEWISYVPSFAYNFGVDIETLVLLNGAVETLLGGILLLGVYTRVVAVLLGIHLFGLSLSLGYNEIMVRDIGLTIATFAVALNGSDEWSIDQKWVKKCKH